MKYISKKHSFSLDVSTKPSLGFTILRRSSGRQTLSLSKGFTIVELLVVIVVIGILAAITIVSYTGITNRANISVLQSDLSNSYNQLNIYQATYNSYPTALSGNCPSAPTADTTLCLKISSNNPYVYYPSANGITFRLVESNTNGVTYSVTESRPPLVTIATADTNWLTIGSQLWAKANLNVGTMVTGVTAQTNNSVLEKYCYLDTAANCTTYGGLYQWGEVMQYTTTEGAQGICPTGSHIPSDNDWKILEMQLGMSQVEADKSTAYRGTDQGTQLKSGGSSSLNIPLAGIRHADGSFLYLSSNGYLWSSSESSTSAWDRFLSSGLATVYRGTNGKGYGFSVRCLGN